MNNAIYISLARQTGLFRNIDIVANNVANASTPGFKSETMVFEKFLVDDKDHFSRKIAFSQDIASYTDHKNGAITTTGRDLDLALEGEGFFKIQTPQGIRYTRRGSFHPNESGQIVNAEGYKLLGETNQPIVLQQTDVDISISSDGSIRVGDAGELRGRIGLAHFANSQKMVRLGDGLYRSDEPALTDAAPARIIQGALEQSNVSPIIELTNLININRSVGSVSGFMADMHELTRKAITAYTRST